MTEGPRDRREKSLFSITYLADRFIFYLIKWVLYPIARLVDWLVQKAIKHLE